MMQRLALLVQGIVQGVGFRPYVWRLANGHRLTGWVQNTEEGIRIEIQGESQALDAFLAELRYRPPQHVKIERVTILDTSTIRSDDKTFVIRDSAGQKAPQLTIPPDLATCNECLDEIRSPGARRFRYPFTNCTLCGPRYTVIERLPYDRPGTAMRAFELCDECKGEYSDPNDRRYHAQPIACPLCGPQLQLLDKNGETLARCDEALKMGINALREGQIVALKGLGGFQLCVDATNALSIAALRNRKHRPHKPFAILCPSVQSAQRYCEISILEQNVLSSSAAPIILLKKLLGSNLADAIAPGNPLLGVMLPCTPLHHLLLEGLQNPIVCTSGNLSEQPMCISTKEALQQLHSTADIFLTHDRPVVRPMDDSVVKITDRSLQILRRARGYTPMPLTNPFPGLTVVALGGHLKNTIALATQEQLIVSQHIGDLTTLSAVIASERARDDLLSFYQAEPAVVACDLHPDYASSRLARSFAIKHRLPLEFVQHHHAHICAGMIEHHLTGSVLGIAWDGTGYGSDGVLWGGEGLRCTYQNYTREAHLRSFPLPGGEQAIREPRRVALGIMYEIFGTDIPEDLTKLFTEQDLATLRTMLINSINSPLTTSMGRLFDAVAVIAGIQEWATFDGHAAMAVEFAAEQAKDLQGLESYPFPLSSGEPAIADWEPMLKAIIADRLRQTPKDVIAARFHYSLAILAVAMAQRVKLPQVVLSGGCFQNALLTQWVRNQLKQRGFDVHIHQNISPNDSGIAVGQAAVAAARVNNRAGI